MTRDELATLGKELVRLKLWKHVEQCRELWRASSGGGKAEWSMEHAARVASVLGTREPLPVGPCCPKCPPPAAGQWNGARTVLMVGERALMACASCGTEWVMGPAEAKVVPSSTRRRA